MEAILSLGTNMGERLRLLVSARRALDTLPATRVVAAAPIYETEPVDVPAESRHLTFLNTVLVLETDLEPERLSGHVHAIEAQLGRVRAAARNAPRPIDIDLVACGNVLRSQPGLRLPHPLALTRRFVCQPLADVRPELVLPGQPLSAHEALMRLPAVPAVALATEQWPDD